MKKKILYLECNSGISGDMTVGALLDLGADKDVLLRALKSLNVDGYHLHFGRMVKSGIDAYDFDVHLEGEEECEAGHNHQEESGYGHSHSEESVYEYSQQGESVQGHSHREESIHSHSSRKEPHHEHKHRNLGDIDRMIDRLDAGESVRRMAHRMFHIVAEAEAKAHCLPVEEVHFHEVGAVDSIVDIISTAVCVDNLGVEEIIVSPLTEGQGHVHCHHGILPVPVPATANIAAAYGLRLRLTENQGEMVTPTGAAIAAALKTGDRLPDHCVIKAIGIGAGKKEFRQANILRAMILESEDEEQEVGEKEDEIWILESNLDDCTGENLGFAMECLLEAGAADVWYVPAYMKKNRPAYLLSVLCREEQIKRMEEIIFSQTTTIGIRRVRTQRTVLPREVITVSTVYGHVRVKVCRRDKGPVYYPEYEDVGNICRQQNLDFMTVYCRIKEEAGRR